MSLSTSCSNTAEESHGEHDCTDQLILICQKCGWNPDPASVSSLVCSGADICCLAWKDEDRSASVNSRKPVITWLIENNNVECVSVCLGSHSFSGESRSPRVIDFTVIDSLGRNPLHALMEVCAPDQDIITMMSAVVDRLQTHPQDVVDWSQQTVLGGPQRDTDTVLARSKGHTVLSLAAENQKLHLIWPLVQELPFFADQIEPISLPRIWSWEWEALGDDRKYFTKEGVEFIQANRSTGSLFQHCVATNWRPNPSFLRSLVEDGANICFSDIHMRMPILHRLLIQGEVECVRCCLLTGNVVDFTLGDVDGFTPFHAVCSFTRRRETVADLIHVILDRIERTSPFLFSIPHSNSQNVPNGSIQSDIVDWYREDNFGHHFFSLAAYYGNLCVVWKSMKERGVLLCNQGSNAGECKTIRLTLKVCQKDWDALGESDKRHFSLSNEIQS